MAKRGRPRKNPEPEPINSGPFEVRVIDGKWLVYLRSSIRAIRHTEQEARDYVAMMS